MKIRGAKLAWPAVAILIGVVVVWAETTPKPSKDYLIMEVEDAPGDQIRVHVIRPGQKPKVMELTIGVNAKEIRVTDKTQPGVTTTLFKDAEDPEGGKLIIAKWLDGSGTVPSKLVEYDKHR